LILNSCSIKGPVSGSNYDISVYGFGVKVEGDFIGIRLGTRPATILKDRIVDKKNDNDKKLDN